MQTLSESDFAAIAAAPLASLRQQWIALFSTSPPPLDRETLARALAWKLQVAAHGDLLPPALRDLSVITAQARAKRISSRAPDPKPASTRLKPSTQLVRVWRGVTYTVEVIDGGYVWEGDCYGSLSEIARLITGTRWNGLLFFGLRERTRSAAPGNKAKAGHAA